MAAGQPRAGVEHVHDAPGTGRCGRKLGKAAAAAAHCRLCEPRSLSRLL